MLYERSNFESEKFRGYNEADINPLNAKLHRICHLLALLGVRHIFHLRGLRVKIYHGHAASILHNNRLILICGLPSDYRLLFLP